MEKYEGMLGFTWYVSLTKDSLGSVLFRKGNARVLVLNITNTGEPGPEQCGWIKRTINRF